MIKVMLINGIRRKSKWNKLILLWTCQCAFCWQTFFYLTTSFPRLNEIWVEEEVDWRKKNQYNITKGHISILCISTKEVYLLDSRPLFQKTKLINGVHCSFFEIMALTETCHLRLKAPIEIDTFESFCFRCHWQDAIADSGAQSSQERTMSSVSWVSLCRILSRFPLFSWKFGKHKWWDTAKRQDIVITASSAQCENNKCL